MQWVLPVCWPYHSKVPSMFYSFPSADSFGLWLISKDYKTQDFCTVCLCETPPLSTFCSSDCRLCEMYNSNICSHSIVNMFHSMHEYKHASKSKFTNFKIVQIYRSRLELTIDTLQIICNWHCEVSETAEAA